MLTKPVTFKARQAVKVRGYTSGCLWPCKGQPRADGKSNRQRMRSLEYVVTPANVARSPLGGGPDPGPCRATTCRTILPLAARDRGAAGTEEPT
jgi:hypothetical protein